MGGMEGYGGERLGMWGIMMMKRVIMGKVIMVTDFSAPIAQWLSIRLII